jgi:hypothetical protein
LEDGIKSLREGETLKWKVLTYNYYEQSSREGVVVYALYS